MLTRTLGNSDLAITPIGFGAWALGGGDWQFGWGEQDDRDSIAAIHRALQLGVNWIDTAAVYGLGRSEEVVAQAMKTYQGAKPCLFTKCGRVWDQDGKIGYCLRPASVRREMEDSLRRLKVDTIDLYQIHWPTADLAETEDGWGTLAELRQEGKARWIGVSNFSVEQLTAIQKIAPVTSLQPPYSLLRRGVEEEILPFCARHGIGVIGYSPMASGMLSGAMTRERAETMPENDWRRRNPEFQEPKLTANLALAERLRAVGARHGRSAGEAAIAWTLRLPAITGAIVGARDAEQVEGIVGGADLKLTEAEVEEIEGQVREQ